MPQRTCAADVQWEARRRGETRFDPSAYAHTRRLATVDVDELMFTVDLYDPAKRRHALDILARVRDSL